MVLYRKFLNEKTRIKIKLKKNKKRILKKYYWFNREILVLSEPKFGCLGHDFCVCTTTN